MGPCSLLYQSWNFDSGREGLGCIVTYRRPGVGAIVSVLPFA